MTEVPHFSVYEGEIIVAEGFYELNNTYKFNVSRIFKPEASLKISNASDLSRPITIDEMKRFTSENYYGKPLSIMLASGPFTFKNSLSYQGLQDFLAAVNKENP